jgi:P22 coat protein - gene protein 5
MANTLLTIGMITREALRLFVNSNAFLKNIDRQYDDQFAREGAKIGSTLKIRLPNDYVVRSGAVAVPADTVEQFTSLTVSQQKGVDMAFTSVDMALSLDDFSKRILRPAMNNLAGAVAADVMTMSESASNFIFKDGGSGVIVTPTATEWLLAGAKLDNNSAPRDSMSRRAMLDPLTQARTVSSLAGLFNSQTKLKEQFETGQMANDVLGFDWFMDQTIIKHTPGTYTAGTVNGASQTGNTLTVNAITGTLVKGDVITVAGVFAVNRVTKLTTGELQQFNVTANVASGATSIPIYPAIVVAPASYGTVTASPANSAVISLLGAPVTTYRKNLAYVPEAFTLATADMELPKGVQQAARESYDGISLRMVGQYDIINDRFIWRLDILYGFTAVRPEWIVTVADVL